MSLVLSNRTRIIATRPVLQNESWCESIRALGCQTAAWPLLEIQAVSGDAAVKAKNVIMKLADYDTVIFVSQNAVHHGFLLVEKYLPQLPHGLDYLAVGKVTAEHVETQLRRLGDGSEVVYAAGSMNSEALLALPQMCNVADKKILIMRGVGGRPTIATVLKQRGATVDHAELYTRALPEQASATLDALVLDASRDLITFFSGETMDNAVKLFKQRRLKDWQTLPVLVPGERVATLAREAGFKSVMVATSASTDAMLQQLMRLVSPSPLNQKSSSNEKTQ